MEPLSIPEDRFKAIAELIHSDSSPVGIDAKKTHILILEKLIQLERKIDALSKEVQESKK